MLFTTTTTRNTIDKLPNEICFYDNFQSTEKIEVTVAVGLLSGKQITVFILQKTTNIRRKCYT